MSRVDFGALEMVLRSVEGVNRSARVVGGPTADCWPAAPAAPELRDERKLRTASCGSMAAPLAPLAALLRILESGREMVVQPPPLGKHY